MMPNNTLDKKLSAVFKALLKEPSDAVRTQKVVKDFQELKTRVFDAGLKETMEAIFSFCSKPTIEREDITAEILHGFLHELLHCHFIESSSAVFNHWVKVMGRLNLESVLKLAPDAASLEAWRKCKELPNQNLEASLLADVSVAYRSVGVDWLVSYCSPSKSKPVLEMFLSRRERPKYLRSWAEVLECLIKEDKRGVWLEFILRQRWSEDNHLETFACVIREEKALLKQVSDLLPVISCKKNAPETVRVFVEHLFSKIQSTVGVEREFYSASLARLGSGILLQDQRGTQAESILVLLKNTARGLRNTTNAGEVLTRTWVLENIGWVDNSFSGKAHVTIQGARLVASAFDKASQGFSINDVLYVTARNLGLTPVNSRGDELKFDPLQHEDRAGGILPGDSVVVEESGWALGHELIKRVVVIRKE